MKPLLAVLLVAGLALPAVAREGFGFAKRAAEIVRTIPPSTNVGARRVKVTVNADRGDVRDDAQTLRKYITEAILAGEGTLADSKAEVEVVVSLDRLDSDETWNTETEYVRQQTGTKQKWNDKKQKMETEPIYSNVPVQKQFKTVSANFDGAFEIAAKDADVASGALDQEFRRKYGDSETSPAPSTLEDDLLRQAARKVAAHLVPTQDRISVLLPRASFESLIPLAESGAWDRYLVAVESMPAKKNAKDEAYRQYALAIAKEATAYQAADRAEALELLRSAASHYTVAAQSNPGEELFRKGYASIFASSSIGVPIARVNESVNRYESWTSGGSVTTRTASNAAPAPAPLAKSGSGKQGMRNQTIVDLAKAGLSDENIILAIDGAQQTEFDVTPEGLIALSKSGVSKSVIAHMQKKSRR